MAVKNFKRSIEIFRCFARYRCYFFLKNTSFYTPARLLGKILCPVQNKQSVIMTDGQKLVACFQYLGPAFIKLGQTLSVRPDIIGEQISEELSKLQDKLPPFDSLLAKQIVEKELGKKLYEVFKTFDDVPVAAASIAQVHFAKDVNGNDLAVKILRPNIEKNFFKDINLLFWIAKIVNKKFPKFKRLKLKQVVQTLAETSKIEMDLQFEASAANELAENFKNDDDIRIPKIYWQLTTSKIMVLERFYGTNIDDTKKLQEQGHDLDDILKKSANIFLKQTLRDGFFHADMHPGNVLVDSDGKICVFDFGIMGRIDKKTKIFMAEMLTGFLNKDYKKVADVHFDAGYIPANQSRELFAQACRAIGEPIFDLPQNQISIASLLQKLFKVTEQFNMETQPQLLLLQKTMMMAEGIARKLNPNTNFWELTRELIEGWGKENLGAKAEVKEVIKQTLDTFNSLGEAVRNLNKVITKNGLVIDPDFLPANTNHADDQFWKGFISAIILSILLLLIVLKL
jgi:ubiquinone biosynthesis protein